MNRTRSQWIVGGLYLGLAAALVSAVAAEVSFGSVQERLRARFGDGATPPDEPLEEVSLLRIDPPMDSTTQSTCVPSKWPARARPLGRPPFDGTLLCPLGRTARQRACRTSTSAQKGLRKGAVIPTRTGFEEAQDGLASDIRSRLAADFTGWESDNTKFEEQFERVVKALQTERESPPEPKL